MRPYISLFIDKQEVEFKEPPTILFTYAHQDLHNPTVVRNNFSKTLTVDGTPKNNRIFGCFGNMNRILENVDGKYTGANFNPSRKIEFILERNSEPIERGYVKLDKVIKKGNQLQYEITLYGGLGQMLYNLTYGDDGEQLKLSDLEYDVDFNMDVNKNTVYDAWRHINGVAYVDAKYDVINFAPCYNGVPQDFTANKVAIDAEYMRTNMETMYEQFFPTTGDTGKTVDGWITGELSKDYTEWQTKDLRSYLQRPVIRFKEIINACCKPENNGGYEVICDEEFFSADNPHYENAWMTLPLLTEVELEEETTEPVFNVSDKITVSGIGEGDYKFNIPLSFGVNVNNTAEVLDTYYTYSEASVGAGTFLSKVADVVRYGQVIAYDSNGQVVGGSMIKCMLGSGIGNWLYKPNTDFKANAETVKGRYYKTEDGYRFGTDKENTVMVFEVNVRYTDGMYFKIVDYTEGISDGYTKGNPDYVYSKGSKVNVSEYFNDIYSDGISTITQEVQKKKITKKTLLNSEHTPCDYFLSYLKMFNLHIYGDNIDKKIYVEKRKNYFTGKAIDIDGFVDRGNNITVTPITFDAKYYVFNACVENDSYLNKEYKDNYGFDYGIQKINTNYNFDNSQKKLLENYVFKCCITNRDRSKYNISIYNDYDNLPPYIIDGMQITLYKDGETSEGNYITPKTSAKSYNWWKEKYFDLFPKPNFLGKDNKGVDGSNVLLFYNGKVENKDNDGNRIGFRLSDDIPQFEILNEGEPCWIWSGDFDIVKEPYYLPMFSRYLTNENNWVTHSWDFGTPRAIYIPDYSIDESSSIYNQYWKAYMGDELDVNTRMVECKVWFRAKVNPDMLKTFVYFDGCYWLIKEIVDYDITSQRPTKCKLVKVNDMNNYLV